MVSSRIKVGIAGALAAATLHAVPAGQAQAEPSLEGQQQANVVTLTQTQMACAPCDMPHVVQRGGMPKATTNVDYLEVVLADLFQKHGKNAIIVISDKPLEQNKEFIDQIADLAQRLYNENGTKIDYVMQVYTATKRPREFALEGTVRLYNGGFPTERNPKTKEPIRTLEDIRHTLKVAEPKLKAKKTVGSTAAGGDGSGRASTDIAPPDFPVA